MRVHRPTRKEIILPSIVVGVICLCAAGVFFRVYRHPQVHVPGTNVQAEIVHWKDRIARVGGKAAYQEFAQSVADLPENDQHTHAHEFGAALYGVEGLSGISVCDERFAQGCFHEFIGEAVIAHGFGIVRTLSEKCAAAIAPDSYFCQHGIGHGLLALSGYDEASLKKALAQCPLLVTNDPLNGCYTGIFMEYYERDVLEGNDSPRPVEHKDWFAPCSDLSGETSRWVCFYSLPRWWHQIYIHQGGQSESAVLANMSALCMKAAQPDQIDICFSGIGHVIPTTVGYKGQASATACERATSDPRYRLLCKADAASDLLVEQLPQEALAACNGLSGASLTYCDAYATRPDQKNIPVRMPALP